MSDNSLNPYNENISLVDLFSKNSIITQKDMTDLASCKEFIVDTYFSVPMYRTLPVKLYGVLSDSQFPTAESKFWQCKIEAETHAKELIRDIHDLEEMKINIEKCEYVLNEVMIKKHLLTEKIEDKAELGFDIRKMEVSISRQRFEFVQLQKRIKYRIEEVNEWKVISNKLSTFFDITNTNYAKQLVDALTYKWKKELEAPGLDQKEKLIIERKLQTLEESIKITSQSTTH